MVLNQVALNASRIVGPAAGGFLVGIAFIGAEGAYIAMGALYVLVVVSLLLPATKPSPSTGRSVVHDLFDGIHYVGSQPKLRYMTIFFFLMIMFSLSAITVLPGFVENKMGRDVALIGPMQAVSAVGGLLVSVLVAPLASSNKALAVYTSMSALAGVSLILTAFSSTLLISFVPMFLYGVGTGGFQTLNSAVVVVESEPSYFGRVTSLSMLAFAGFMLVGLPVGLAADKWGEANVLIAMGLVTLAIVAVMSPLMARAPSARKLGEPPAAAAG